MKNSITVSLGGKDSEYGKILLSNVMVTRKRNLIIGRTWRTLDIQTAVSILVIHLLALFAPFTFTWRALWAAYATSVLRGILGIGLSYHRNLAHHSFKLPRWLEYTFAYIGVLAFQRDPISWVSVHRYHHQYVDTEKDTHSPIFGFWFSHMGWLFDSGYMLEKVLHTTMSKMIIKKCFSWQMFLFNLIFQYQERNNVEDLKKQAFYRFIKKTYVLHLFAYVVLVYAFGGFRYLVWVVGVSTTFAYQGTFLVNSACHIWGNQAWNTGDLSKNNWWVTLIALGEGWHNNHHAFEYSARQGLEWWQFDFVWYMILFLEAIGLATNVKLPTEDHKLKKSFASLNKFK
ncbi:putative fatty acid desaturase domain, acyl-CoA desaturase [Helianthus annuus]|nr:putative fatty acid desaturase domain, acyl-CoA desaturase [Helianthus annuus]